MKFRLINQIPYQTILVLLVIAAGVLVPFHSSQAGVIDNFATNAVFKVIAVVADLISGLVANTLLPLAASLLNWVFNEGEFIRAGVVVAGWEITRDLANMGFILVLLVIGFATILRYSTYGIKALLPKLILAALLINFSLVIAGVFIDMGNDIGFFFASGGQSAAAGTAEIDGSLMKSLRMSAMLFPPSEGQTAADIDAGKEPQVAILLRALFRLALTLIVTFLFFAMALLMTFRIVFLWILLILAPLAWLALAVPKAGYWNKWWRDFLKWAFIPVVLGFFIYIAVLTGETFALGARGGYVSGLAEAEGGAVPMAFRHLLQYIAVIIILAYGITVAPGWAGEGAVKAMNWAGKARDWSLGKTKDYAKRKGLQAGGALAERALYGKDEEGARTKPRFGTQFVAKTKIGSQLLRPAAAMIQKRANNIKAQEKELAKLDPRLLQLRRGSLDADGKVAADRALAAKSLLQPSDIISKKDIAASMSHAAALGLEKEMLIAAPDIAKEFNVINNSAEQTAERIKKVFERIKPEEWAKMNGGAIDVDGAKTEEEKNARSFVRDMILDGFAEGGGLHGGHLTTAAYKNPALWQSTTGALKKEFEAGPAVTTVEEPHPLGLTDAMGRPVMVTRTVTGAGRKFKKSVRSIVVEGPSGVLASEEKVEEAEARAEEKKT